MTSSITTIKRIWDRAQWLTTGQRSWRRLEYFDESWKKRIETMASYINPGESVVDLGCGRMWLKPLLKDNVYYPVDYTQRDEITAVADFNAHEFPEIVADVAFVSGTLEYVEDYGWFAGKVCSHSKRCIVSYCTTEHYPSMKTRSQKAWKSHLSRSGLVGLFAKNRMHLDVENTTVPQNPIFVFSKRENESVQADPHRASSRTHTRGR